MLKIALSGLENIIKARTTGLINKSRLFSVKKR